jgi:hypothetical protein
MEPILEQLAELVQTERVRAKWVITPSAMAGHTIAERFIAEGIAWGNLRFVTVPELAAHIAGPALARQNRTGLDPAAGPALVLALLLDLSATPHFRTIAEQPGVADALWSTISELRLCGISSATLQTGQFTSLAKGDELRALLGAYENHLDEHRLADSADCLTLAAELSDKFPVLPDSLLIEIPGSCGSPAERDFLDSLPCRRMPARVAVFPGLEFPAGFHRLNSQFECVTPEKPDSDASRLAWLAKPADAPNAFEDGSLSLFRAAGREAEVEEIFRRIHAGSLPVGSVEVVCAQPADYGPLFWEKAARYGLAVTIARGIPATLTRPVRAALGLCGWIETNYPAVRLARLLEAGVVEPGADADLSGSAAARILRQCGATLGRESYNAALVGFAASCEERAADLELDEDIRASWALRATRARKLAHWIETVFDAIPEPSGGIVMLGKMLDGLELVVEDAASVGGPEDGAAKSAIGVALQSLAPLRDLRRPMNFHLALIRTQVESVTVAAARPSPGALHVSSLGSPSFAARPVVFVVGLEEGAVFPTGMEDPVLLDDERRAIAPERLHTSRDRISDAVYRGVSHLAGLRGQVTLSYSCRDLRQGREAYPSWLIFQAHQLLQPGSGLSHDVLIHWLGDPATLVTPAQSAATSDIGWWLSGLRGVGDTAMPLVSAAFPGIGCGIVADVKRQSDEFTEFDGLVPAAGADLDPRRADQVFSASRFESFAKCPFRFFLERGLGLDPVEDEEPDPDAWLDALTRGAALHEIYAAFLRCLRKENRRPVSGDWKTLWETAREELDRRREEIPPPSEAVYKAEMEQIERDLRLFLRLEIARDGAAPVALETPFGFGEVQGEEPLGQPDPVEIDIGSGKIRLRGRIDRIDRYNDGGFEVIDYKTGSRWDEFDGTFSGGRLLQHALYAIAAQKLLRREQKKPLVKLSTYYFCTERGWGDRVSKPANLDVKPVLSDIAEAIAAGAFVRGGEAHDCRYCDYARACPIGEVEQMETKREALISIGRLAQHE